MAKPPPSPGDGDSPRATLADELRALIDGGREWLGREAEYQKARASLAGRYLALAAIASLLALMLVFFALMALVVGLLLALAPGMGGWGALGAVLLGLGFAVLVSLLAVRSGWRRLKRVLGIGA